VDSPSAKTDARNGLVSDANRAGEEEYIVCLIGRVTTVSVETQKLLAGLEPILAP